MKRIANIYTALKNAFGDFFYSRKLAIIKFKYTEQRTERGQISVKEHPVIAKVRPTAAPSEVATLFPFTDTKIKFKVVDVKIYPLNELPRV